MEEILKRALRNRYRFPGKFQLTVEDLYDMSVQELDRIYIQLKSEAKEKTMESLLETKVDTKLDDKCKIVETIVRDKQAEIAKNKEKFNNRMRKEKLMQLLVEKQEQELVGKSKDEIQAMINELDAEDA